MDCVEVPMPIIFSELEYFHKVKMIIKYVFDYTNGLVYDNNQINI